MEMEADDPHPGFCYAGRLEGGDAVQLARGKSPEVEEVTLETIDEGLCVQMLHIGPYESEKETMGLIQSFAQASGLKLTGPHHEIYLSDPRRVPPDRLKTILRVPAARQGS
jgi:hypothetical protein